MGVVQLISKTFQVYELINTCLIHPIKTIWNGKIREPKGMQS
jgi:hypothetical protein